MTLPASGTMTGDQIRGEVGGSLPFSLSSSAVLSLAGKGLPLNLPGDLYGKSGTAALSATALGQDNQYDSSNSGGTGTASGTVYPAGGSGGYSIAWVVASNPSGATVGALNGSTVNISKAYSKLSDGSASVTFNVTVTDSQGHTYTVNGVVVTVEWFSNR